MLGIVKDGREDALYSPGKRQTKTASRDQILYTVYIYTEMQLQHPSPKHWHVSCTACVSRKLGVDLVVLVRDAFCVTADTLMND